MSFTIALQPHKNSRIDALTPRQRLRWVLEFMWCDLDELAPEALAAIGDDLVHATAPWRVGAGWMQGKTRECTEVPATDVRPWQQEIRACVQSVTGPPIDLVDMNNIQARVKAPEGWVIPEGRTRLVRVRYCPGYERVVRVSESPDDRIAILTGVANLLIEFTDWLATCAVCQRPFLRQSRQAYCTVRCSNKIRNRRRKSRQTHLTNGQLVTTLN